MNQASTLEENKNRAESPTCKPVIPDEEWTEKMLTRALDLTGAFYWFEEEWGLLLASKDTAYRKGPMIFALDDTALNNPVLRGLAAHSKHYRGIFHHVIVFSIYTSLRLENIYAQCRLRY